MDEMIETILGKWWYLFMTVQGITHAQCCAHLRASGQYSEANNRARPVSVVVVSDTGYDSANHCQSCGNDAGW